MNHETPMTKSDSASKSSQDFDSKTIFIIALVLTGLFYVVYTQFLLESNIYLWYLKLCSSHVQWLAQNLMGESTSTIVALKQLNITVRTAEGPYINIGQSSDGLLPIAILSAAILAWPGVTLRKALFAIAGIFLLYGLNIIRLSSALYVDIYYPAKFELINGYIAPLAFTLLLLIYFLIYIKFSKART